MYVLYMHSVHWIIGGEEALTTTIRSKAVKIMERPPSQRRPLRTKSFFPTTFSLFVAILHIINLRIISADENYCVANRTVDGRNCVFPFFRNGLLLYECARIEAGRDRQCSVTNAANYTAVEMADCDCPQTDPAQCRTELYHVAADRGRVNESAECVFPFTYQGREYRGCTTAGHSESWCAVSVKELTGEAENWGPCGSRDCPGYRDVADESVCKTQKNRICQFPFIYKNKTYTECTLEDHHRPWCATSTQVSGRVGQFWDNCNANCSGYEKALDRCLAQDGWPCVFPFIFQDRVYRSCTIQNHRESWCSVQNFHNGTMAKWKECRINSPQCQALMKGNEANNNNNNNGSKYVGVWILLLLLGISLGFNVYAVMKYKPDTLLAIKKFVISRLGKPPGIMDDNDDGIQQTSSTSI